MTTIAWDGNMLAADSQSTNSGLPRQATKIWKIKNDLLFGCAGDIQDGIAVKDWLEVQRGDRPKVDDNFSGLLIRQINEIVPNYKGPKISYEVYKLENKLIQIPVKEKQVSIGSGRDFAIAAMRLNCDAAVAVSIAIEFDVYSGGLIDVLTFD